MTRPISRDSFEVLVDYLLELRYASLDISKEVYVRQLGENHNVMIIILLLLFSICAGAGVAAFLFLISLLT